MVITYKLSWLTYRMVKRKIKLPYVGLPNILLGEKVVPELLQYDATAPKLAEAVIQLYEDEDARKAQLSRFSELHQQLTRETSVIAADIVLHVGRC
jgi:lipid-A-disaccharide synthase